MGPKLVLGVIIDMERTGIEKIIDYLSKIFRFTEKLEIKSKKLIKDDVFSLETFVKLNDSKKLVIFTYNYDGSNLIIDISFGIKPIIMSNEFKTDKWYIYGLYPAEICNYLYNKAKEICVNLDGVNLVWLGEEIEYYDIVGKDGNINEDIIRRLYYFCYKGYK